MSEPSLLEERETKDRESDAAERIERARKAREAAEKQVRERSKNDPSRGEWVTEKAWRND